MRFIGLIIAMFLAAAAGFVVYKVAGGGVSTQVVVASGGHSQQQVGVLVAAAPIQVGTVVSADMMEVKPWPKSLVLESFMQNSADTVGMVARSAFEKGEPLSRNKLANPSDPGFLAAALASGKRAVTISTDGVAGVAGFVFPGDRVDVLITHDVPSAQAPAADSERAGAEVPQEPVTETVISNLRVLAVDQRYSSGTDGDKIKPPTSVSLEVDLEEAQKLRLAQHTGTLSLALRSLMDKDVEAVSPVTTKADLTRSVVEPLAADAGVPDEVLVCRGASCEKTSVKQPVQDVGSPIDAAGLAGASSKSGGK